MCQARSALLCNWPPCLLTSSHDAYAPSLLLPLRPTHRPQAARLSLDTSAHGGTEFADLLKRLEAARTEELIHKVWAFFFFFFFFW